MTNNEQQPAPSQADKATLVDLFVDSQLDWRQLFCEANKIDHNQSLITEHLSETQIKRQQLIHELIQTERHHCLTLALMRQVYLAGLLRLNELRHSTGCNQASSCQDVAQSTTNNNTNNSQTTSANTSQTQVYSLVHQAQSSQVHSLIEPIDIERLFPALEELIQAHELFFAHLRLRLLDCCSPATIDRPLIGVMGPLGDLLVDQFKLGLTSQSEPAQLDGQQQRRRVRRHEEQIRANLSNQSSSNKSQQCGDKQQTNGAKLLQAYARFCGQQNESSRYFKQLMQHDKGFKQFIEVSSIENWL